MPEPGPFGETFFEASHRAIVAASLVNKPSGGKVEVLLTLATQRRFEGRSGFRDRRARRELVTLPPVSALQPNCHFDRPSLVLPHRQ